MDASTVDPRSIFMDLSGQTEASDIVWAPPGRYPVRLLEVTPTLSNKSGAPMLTIKGEIAGGEYEGTIFFDYIIIASGVKGAGMGKKKLRGLIGDLVDKEGQTPALQIANMLVGKIFFADLGTDVRQSKNKDTGELTPITVMIDGKQVQAMQNKVDSYYTHSVTTQAQAPVQHVAQPAQSVQQLAQQQLPMQTLPQGYPQQQLQQPVPVQQPVQQFVPQQQFAAGIPQGVPGGFAPAVNGSAPIAQGVPPWATAPVAPAPTASKRGK